MVLKNCIHHCLKNDSKFDKDTEDTGTTDNIWKIKWFTKHQTQSHTRNSRLKGSHPHTNAQRHSNE